LQRLYEIGVTAGELILLLLLLFSSCELVALSDRPQWLWLRRNGGKSIRKLTPLVYGICEGKSQSRISNHFYQKI
jgi:hypothetical protein